MKTTEELQKEIAALKTELAHVRGTETEIYTRIVGYYRPVKNWNKGKKEEYGQRVEFCVSENTPQQQEVELVADNANTTEESKEEMESTTTILVNEKGSIRKYKLFYSDNCPGCPPVKQALHQIELAGEEVNANTSEGLQEALKNNVTGTPTVLFYDEGGNVIKKAHTPAQIRQFVSA